MNYGINNPEIFNQPSAVRSAERLERVSKQRILVMGSIDSGLLELKTAVQDILDKTGYDDIYEVETLKNFSYFKLAFFDIDPAPTRAIHDKVSDSFNGEIEDAPRKKEGIISRVMGRVAGLWGSTVLSRMEDEASVDTEPRVDSPVKYRETNLDSIPAMIIALPNMRSDQGHYKTTIETPTDYISDFCEQYNVAFVSVPAVNDIEQEDIKEIVSRYIQTEQ